MGASPRLLAPTSIQLQPVPQADNQALIDLEPAVLAGTIERRCRPQPKLADPLPGSTAQPADCQGLGWQQAAWLSQQKASNVSRPVPCHARLALARPHPHTWPQCQQQCKLASSPTTLTPAGQPTGPANPRTTGPS